MERPNEPSFDLVVVEDETKGPAGCGAGPCATVGDAFDGAGYEGPDDNAEWFKAVDVGVGSAVREEEWADGVVLLPNV